MVHNPFLARLGYGPEARVVIFHADDLGMCHAHNAAFADILAVQPTACGSAMVPAPWFNELADLARAHPLADIGVHTTLTSEWRAYRWGPLTTRDPASGLVDAEGCFWASVPDVHTHVDVAAVAAELRAQIERALAAGVDVTHIDTHMGAVSHPTLWAIYINLALEFRVPAMLPRLDRAQMSAFGLSAAEGEALMRQLDELERSGQLPIVDHLVSLFGNAASDRLQQYQDAVAQLPPGLTHFLYHAARPGPEIKAIAPPDDWPARVADWEVFANPDFHAWLARGDVHVIGYRLLREAMRA